MKNKGKRTLSTVLGFITFALSGNYGFETTATADATETVTPTLEFAAYNLSLKDNIHIKYAVNVENAEASDVKVLVWTQAPAAYEYGTQDTELSFTGEYYKGELTSPVFSYTELSAKEMTDVIYACAYVETDGVGYYSEPSKYSILQYAYGKLGKTDKEASEAENLPELLQAMLDYGAAMQTYTGYKTDFLANAEDIVYVKIDRATFQDGFNYGLFKAGEVLTVTPDEGYTLREGAAGYSIDGEGNILFTVPTEKLCDESSFIEIADAAPQPLAVFDFTNTQGTMTPELNQLPLKDYEETHVGSGRTLTADFLTEVYYACDGLGNYGLQVGLKEKAGSFAFTVDEDVNKVVIKVGGCMLKNAVIRINGGEMQTVTENSYNGEYAEIEVDTSRQKTVTLQTCEGGYRAMIDSITYL